jgi:hypothetical protein
MVRLQQDVLNVDLCVIKIYNDGHEWSDLKEKEDCREESIIR